MNAGPATWVALLGLVIVTASSTWLLADDDSATKITSAETLIRNKDYSGARLLLKDIDEESPGYREARWLAAQCDEGTGDTEAAIADYQKTVELSPNDDVIKRNAKAAIDRLNEGRKIVLRTADQLERDAVKYKDKNKLAFDTVTAAVEKLRSSTTNPTTSPSASPTPTLAPVPLPVPVEKTIPRRPPPDAIEFGRHHYKSFPAGLTWHLAKAQCESMGGYLICIESAEEQAFVENTFNETDYWIGLNDERLEGKWEWASGAPFDYTNWAIDARPTEPNNGDGLEHVGHLWKKHGLKWADFKDGMRKFQYICEWDQ